MKATELRIGNLVYYSDKETTCVITDITITKIYEGAMSAYPIPLTEEWLLKFGFYTNGINDIYYTLEIEEDSCDLYYLKEDKTIAIGQPYEAGGTELKFEYVHQLQNLVFALTGKELEIK